MPIRDGATKDGSSSVQYQCVKKIDDMATNHRIPNGGWVVSSCRCCCCGGGGGGGVESVKSQVLNIFLKSSFELES